MPTFNIIKKSEYKKTFRNESIKGQFDLKIKTIEEHFEGNINIENKKWQIGAIIGSSGSGKTTIAKQVFKNTYITNYNYGKGSVLDEMPKEKTTNEITKTFNSVGFATVWSWLKPYQVLSSGEKMRVDIAHAILSPKKIICFDEFTSVVDRTVAQTSSFAIQKAIRKTTKKFIAISCHYDVIDWLQPDWIYDTDKKEFFFIQKLKKDQKSTSKFTKQTLNSGNYLKNIII